MDNENVVTDANFNGEANVVVHFCTKMAVTTTFLACPSNSSVKDTRSIVVTFKCTRFGS